MLSCFKFLKCVYDINYDVDFLFVCRHCIRRHTHKDSFLFKMLTGRLLWSWSYRTACIALPVSTTGQSDSVRETDRWSITKGNTVGPTIALHSLAFIVAPVSRPGTSVPVSLSNSWRTSHDSSTGEGSAPSFLGGQLCPTHTSFRRTGWWGNQ